MLVKAFTARELPHLVGPGETHWFENDSAENFAFAEFWAPPPSGTVWTTAGDRCTWAPSS